MGGREIHGTNVRTGGFGKLPTKEELKELKEKLEEGLRMALDTYDLVKNVFTKETDYLPNTPELAARRPNTGRYELWGPTIVSTLHEGEVPVEEYKNLIEEVVVPHSNAKHSRINGKPFMVGALARLTLNRDLVEGTAKDLIEKLPIHNPPTSSFENNIAQYIELVWSIERSIEDVNRLLEMDLENLPSYVDATPKPGKGVGAMEAPRGILIHDYEFDEKGNAKYVNIITPTAFFAEHVEVDFKKAIPNIITENDDSIRFKLEKIVRAYDPCISCSVHIVRL